MNQLALTHNTANTAFTRNATIVISVLFLAAVAAMAGGDTTFGSTTTGPLGQITGWMQGSMGKLFALGCLAVGLAIGIVKQEIMAVAVGVGIALAASAGPTVLNGIFSAGM